ncbi:MAG: hypothetical protein AB3N15_01895 [Paracoccaceae bacterium]
MLQRAAKKSAKSPKTASGTVEAKGKLVMLKCHDKPPPGVAKKLREFFKKVVGLSVKIQLISPDGSIEEDGEDDAVTKDEGADAPQAAEDTGGNEKLVAALNAAINKLMPRIKAASQTNPKAKPHVEKLLAETKKAGAAGDQAMAKKRLAQLQDVLVKVEGAAKASAKNGLSLVKLGKARIEWTQTRDLALADLERLKAHIKNEYADMPEVTSEVTNALGMLDKSLSVFQANLHDQLDEVLNASEDAVDNCVKAARKTIGVFNKQVASDPVLGALDGNDILPDIQITEPIRNKLNEIATALGE